MHKILKFLFSRPVTTSMFFLMFAALGIFAMFKIPLELNPKVELPKAYILTSWSGASAETMESYITTQIEAAAVTVRGVKNIESETSVGSSRVSIEFRKDADFKYSVLELGEKISALSESFPDGVVPVISKAAPKEVGEQRFISYSVSAPLEEMTIRKIMQDKVKPALLSVPGVSDVRIIGGLDRQIKILLDEKKLDSYGITFSTIMMKLSEMDVVKNCGEMKNGNSSMPIIIYDNTTSLNDISVFPIADLNGNIIRLSDISDISNAMEDRMVYNRINGEPKITIEIVKEPGANIISSADGVLAKILKVNESIPEIKFKKEYDQSDELRLQLKNLLEQSLISLLGVFIVLIVFIRNYKAPFIILTTIFFSIISVILIFSLLDISLNILSLSGLSLGIGILVDNAIVVYENVVYHRSVKGDYLESVINAVAEVSKPLLGSTLTTAVVFIPFFFLPDELKEIFFNFGIGMALSITVSLIFALSFIPFVIKYFDFKPVEKREEKFRISILYEKILKAILKHKWASVIITLWILGLPLWLLPEKVDSSIFKNFYGNTIESEFYKENKETIFKLFGGVWNLFNSNVSRGDVFSYSGNESYLDVYLTTEDGTDMDVLNGINIKVEKLLSGYSEYIKNYTTTVYENYSIMRIDFKDKYNDSSFPYKLKADLIGYFTEFGGLHATITGYGQAFSAGSPFYESSSFRLKITGYQYQKVKDIALELKEKLEENPRIEKVDADKSQYGRAGYEITAKINRQKISELGLSVKDILEVMRAHTGGRSFMKSAAIDNEKIDVNLKYSGYNDYQMYDLLNQHLKDKSGNSYLLKDLVEIKREKTLTSITRVKQEYSRDITMDYIGPYMYGREYIKSVVDAFPLPFGFKIKSGYSFFPSERAEIAFMSILLAAVFMIFLVTASIFESFKKPLIVLSVLPMAMIGVFLIYYFADANFGTGAYAGLVLLFGICVNNSIVLVDYINRLLESGQPLETAIIEGSKRRARPVIMTTLTTIIGLLPFVLIGDDTSIWFGIALSVIGGMVSSTIIVLFILPAVYKIFYKSK